MLDEAIRIRKELAVESQVRRWRVDADDFARMCADGILPADERFELLDGLVYHMSPIGHAHAIIVALLVRHVMREAGESVLVWPQNPVRMSEDTVLQPDVALLRLPTDTYRERQVRPDDVLLVIEVADSSLAYDRQVKASLYAAVGIPEYWLVAIGEERVEVYREPTAEGYREIEILAPGATITPVALPELTIDVAEILGRSEDADDGAPAVD